MRSTAWHGDARRCNLRCGVRESERARAVLRFCGIWSGRTLGHEKGEAIAFRLEAITTLRSGEGTGGAVKAATVGHAHPPVRRLVERM